MRIALISDYFYPAIGGVQSHIIGLANVIKRNGHDVVVITHKYDQQEGILIGEKEIFITPLGTIDVNDHSNNVKIRVFYLPMGIVTANCTFPCLLPTHRLLPGIFERENIQIVHGHSSHSALAIDSIWIGKR